MAKSYADVYKQLCLISTELETYKSILALLYWDEKTHMPPGGASSRSRQIALLSQLIHKRQTDRKFSNCLKQSIHIQTGTFTHKKLSKTEQINLREWRWDFVKATKLPATFIKNFSQLTSEAGHVWVAAKKSKDFTVFAPFLEKIISMARKKADILGFSDHPYDALLEAYEPCMTTARVEKIFVSLQEKIQKLLSQIVKKKKVSNSDFLHYEVDDAKQLEISHLLLSKLPINLNHSRFDLTTHPFCVNLHPHDARITSKFNRTGFINNIFSILHEAGHALYGMGLPEEHWGTPLGEAASFSIHESQSLWWETLIGHSFSFWKFFYPHLQTSLPFLKEISLKNFYEAIHEVKPSFIRIEADEVTYCLHIILRFEIEKMLISGKLPVNDLPDAWNAKMKELFGIVPTSDADGFLQDMHWACGDFGYFPTYALGHLFASHFFSAFNKTHEDWSLQAEQGNFALIRDWLKEKVHRWGRTYNSEELAKKITGKPLNEEAYATYLTQKYTKIYELSDDLK